MDTQLKAKWVEALRSGKYEQGRQKLHGAVSNAYCCLGVLCEVAGLPIDPETGNAIVGVAPGSDDYTPIYNLLGSSNWAEELWRRNDGLQGFRTHSFAEIADYIEANL